MSDSSASAPPNIRPRVNKVPLVSWVAAKQQMQFAKPSDTLFRTAFAGADVVHLYLPFKFGRCAYKVARSMGIPVTAGFHLQPENVMYSAGPLKYLPGMSGFCTPCSASGCTGASAISTRPPK